MIGSAAHTSRKLEFGLYRDGDNNLDQVQETTIAQARTLSARAPDIEFSVEDTTSHRGSGFRGTLHTEEYRIDDGVERDIRTDAAHDMSARGNLANFVARTLEN